MNTYETYVNRSEDVSRASEVWSGISPRELNIVFDDLERLKIEELENKKIVILSAKETQGDKGKYFSCLCVSEENPDSIFMLSTGATAISRKLRTASEKRKIPMRGTIILCNGKEGRQYWDMVSNIQEVPKTGKTKKGKSEKTA